jgi:hypothetical protein
MESDEKEDIFKHMHQTLKQTKQSPCLDRLGLTIGSLDLKNGQLSYKCS